MVQGGKLLVGREVLSKIAIVINGSRKETCLAEEIINHS